MANEIHRSKVGTYHPAPEPNLHGSCTIGDTTICPKCNYVAWTIHDSRGTIDGGPACDKCGKCECGNAVTPENAQSQCLGEECIGLSFAFICLDGGETLCEECAAKAGLSITDCDCERG